MVELVDVLLEVVEVDAGLLGLLGCVLVAAGAACDLYKEQKCMLFFSGTVEMAYCNKLV